MARESAFDAPMALEVPRISPRTAPPAAPELASLSSMLSGIVARNQAATSGKGSAARLRGGHLG